MPKIISIAEAIQSLAPGAEWILTENDYENIEWISDEYIKPTLNEIESEMHRLQAEADASLYKELRAAEYPPMEDYLDGIVKGDQDQIDTYIAACLAVKEKYPKP